MPPFPLSYNGKEESELDVPLLNPPGSDKEENDPDVPPLPSTDNGEEENDPELNPLPLLDISKEVKTSNDMSVTYHGSTLALGSQVRKLFE